MVWSTFGRGVYLKYMKLYVYCEYGLEGMMCDVEGWFWYVYAWCLLEGLNDYLEEFMSKWSTYTICEVLCMLIMLNVGMSMYRSQWCEQMWLCEKCAHTY